MSAEDDIFDAITRHQIFVLRYAKGREREAELFIARQLEEVIFRLESGNLTDFGRSRAQAQASDLYQYLLASNKEYAEEYKADLTRFGQYEADFNRTAMEKHLEIDLSLPSPAQIQQAAFTEIMGLEPSKGYTLGGMLDDFGPANANLVMDQIRASIVLGDTTDELTREIRGLIPLQSRKAATLARTAVNHVSVQARKETLKENDDVLLGYEWVATLDSRTSMICMARDGVIYRDYDNDPKPPAHFNCRSTITPKVNPKFDLGADIVGTRAAKGSSGAGQVSAGLNYDQWLRKQSKPFQNKVLGKSRAKLFRDGLTLDKFVDDRGETYTLRQLAELDTQFNGSATDFNELLRRLEEEKAKRDDGASLTSFTDPSQPQGEVTVTGLESVRLKSADDARVRLKAWAKNNGKDARWFDYARFEGRISRAEYELIDELDDDMCRALESCLDDLDNLADAFNIPRLRGFVRAGSGAAADMGDGIMGLNTKYLGRKLEGLSQRQPFTRVPDSVVKWLKQTRKDDKKNWGAGRPFTSDSYMDNEFDRFRTTIFHEFGHHVHQMYKTSKNVPYKYNINLPPVEKLMRTKRGAFTPAKRHSPTRYGDTNQEEWFAENFSMYYMGRRDLVDDKFIDLIEDLLRGAYATG